MFLEDSNETRGLKPHHTSLAHPQFHDVLALVTSTSPWSPASGIAIDIAAHWDANVTGCYVPSSLRDRRAYEADPTTMDMLASMEYESPDESAAFHAFAKDRGVHRTSWVVTHTAIAMTLRKLGAWHDLAVIERDMVDEACVFDILGEGMLSSRIPCIVLPPRWDRKLVFDRIAIAWNGNFEATRALRSALPLIRLAKQVILINGEVRAPYESLHNVVEPDPVIYLMHHGVAAKPHYIRVPSDEAGKTLLQKAYEECADLLVMGAYGHSRIRERVLGGATRHVMVNADLPVFMQH